MTANNGIVIDLPRPPSLNRLWNYGRRKVWKSKVYRRWIDEADKLLMAGPKIKGIKGDFRITMFISGSRKNSDLDNFWKATMDFLQRVHLIENDCMCVEQHAYKVNKSEAPEGMRIFLTAQEPKVKTV